MDLRCFLPPPGEGAWRDARAPPTAAEEEGFDGCLRPGDLAISPPDPVVADATDAAEAAAGFARAARPRRPNPPPPAEEIEAEVAAAAAEARLGSRARPYTGRALAGERLTTTAVARDDDDDDAAPVPLIEAAAFAFFLGDGFGEGGSTDDAARSCTTAATSPLEFDGEALAAAAAAAAASSAAVAMSAASGRMIRLALRPLSMSRGTTRSPLQCASGW